MTDITTTINTILQNTSLCIVYQKEKNGMTIPFVRHWGGRWTVTAYILNITTEFMTAQNNPVLCLQESPVSSSSVITRLWLHIGVGVVLYVQVLVCIIWHVRVQLRVKLLHRSGVCAAACRRQLGRRDCDSVLRALHPGGLDHVISSSIHLSALILHLPFTSLRMLLLKKIV